MSRSVGEFTLIGNLGEGSFATVFLARHRDSKNEFAMKAISRARLQGKLQENLESEISILKSFRHGNIVELYDIKKTERHIYLVLEYCAGGDLRALIRREGRLGEPAARHFMRHLGAGLHFLWSQNLVHRDLKPQNLLLNKAGLDATLKIADFGFARHLAKASMAETICGSPLYMAPEILQGHKYDAGADLWSVGAILFEMLAGKPPFGGANQIQLLGNIRRAPTPPARKGFYPMPEGVPRPGHHCGELLCRLLVPDPRQRASFREFFQSDVLRPPSVQQDQNEINLRDTPGRPSQIPVGTPAEISRPLDITSEARGPGPGGPTRMATIAAESGQSNIRAANPPSRRASWNHARGGATNATSGKRVSQGEGAQERGSWWPLTGWRWGGGTSPDTAAREGGERPAQAKQFWRTLTDPTAMSEAQSRPKSTERDDPQNSRLLHRAADGSRQEEAVVEWGQPMRSSRPVTMPRLPGGQQVAVDDRTKQTGRDGAAMPIPIQTQLHPRQGHASTRNQEDSRYSMTSSPRNTTVGTSRWLFRDGHRRADEDLGLAPLPSYEPQRLRSRGPNSAPEVSYMGYAAAQASGGREREAPSAAMAGVESNGDDHRFRGNPTLRRRSGDVGMMAREAIETERDSVVWPVRRLDGERGIDPPAPRARPPSLDVSKRPPESPRHQRPKDHVSQLVVASATAGAFQPLASSPPGKYPVQLATLMSAQQKHLWGGGLSAPVAPGGLVFHGVTGADEANTVRERSSRSRYVNESSQHARAPDNDESGGSEDFVMVDDSVIGEHVTQPGGYVHHASQVGEGRRDDLRVPGPRLVGPHWAWGDSSAAQAALGVPQGVGSARGTANGDVNANGRSTVAGLVSIEPVVRCLQIVELFGRRAILLAQLGDSRVEPAIQARRRDKLAAHARTACAWNTKTDGTKDSHGDDHDTLRGLEFTRIENQDRAVIGDGNVFGQDQGLLQEGKLPCFASEDSGTSPFVLRSSLPAMGATADASRCDTDAETCCDSHRFFGEALVLYLKSLSMAKEAIVWGNQALEVLSSTRSVSNSQQQPSPPSSHMPASPSVRPPAKSPRARGAVVEGASDAAAHPRDGMSLGTPRSAGSRAKVNTRIAAESSRPRVGSGRLDEGSSASASTSGPSPTASEAHVAAWGASLITWLTGQFSAVLRRAERCRTELRGPQGPPGVPTEETSTVTKPPSARVVPSPPARSETDVRPKEKRLDPGRQREASGSRFSGEISKESKVAGDGGNGSVEAHKHGATAVAVAVSARDIVVRAALAQGQESAASEVLGMWEPARKGYERAALLLETLILDSLVARPDGASSSTRTGGVSPRGWRAGSSAFDASAGCGGGILSEADQRVVQNYMSKFARRAVEVAAIERDDAQALSALGTAAKPVIDAASSSSSVPSLTPTGNPAAAVDSLPSGSLGDTMIDGHGARGSLVRQERIYTDVECVKDGTDTADQNMPP